MSLPCLNLCHRIQFQSNIVIIPTIKFVITKRIQFVETHRLFTRILQLPRSYCISTCLLNLTIFFTYSLLAFMQKDQCCSVSPITHLYLQSVCIRILKYSRKMIIKSNQTFAGNC